MPGKLGHGEDDGTVLVELPMCSEKRGAADSASIVCQHRCAQTGSMARAERRLGDAPCGEMVQWFVTGRISSRPRAT